jgi:prophage regulatory protein
MNAPERIPEQPTPGAAPQPTGLPNAATLAHWERGGHVTGTPTRPGKLLRLPLVEDRTGLGKSSIYAGVKAGTFPAPVRLSARAVAWRESEIDQWIAARTATR